MTLKRNQLMVYSMMDRNVLPDILLNTLNKSPARLCGIIPTPLIMILKSIGMIKVFKRDREGGNIWCKGTHFDNAMKYWKVNRARYLESYKVDE